MSACPRPSFRSLDMYRLFVARGLTQREVARSFGVSPARVCVVIRRVRQWVDQSVGDWFLPREHRIRFYVALHCEQIRPNKTEADHPQALRLVGPGWSYSRQRGNSPHITPKTDSALTPKGINAADAAQLPPSAATSSSAADCASPAIAELAYRLAELLTLSKKPKNVSPDAMTNDNGPISSGSQAELGSQVMATGCWQLTTVNWRSRL